MTEIVVVTLVKDELTELRKTAQSVQQQSISRRHLVVSATPANMVEDHLTDLPDPKRQIIDEVSSGIYPNMNFALQRCADSLVIFLNAGDTFASEDSLEALVLTIDGEHVWAYGGFNLLGSSEGPIRYMRPPQRLIPLKQLYAKEFVCHEAVLARADFMVALGGFDESLKVAADWDLLCRMSEARRPASIDYPIINFRLGGYASQNRRLANRELYLLRKRYLHKASLLARTKNRLWYFFKNIALVGLRIFPVSAIKTQNFRVSLPHR